MAPEPAGGGPGCGRATGPPIGQRFLFVEPSAQGSSAL